MSEEYQTTYFEDVAVGDTAPQMTVPDVGIREFVRYAGASGDFNPIHYDQRYAKNAGNDSIFGQGMFTAGILSNALCEWLGRDAIRKFTTRFDAKVSPGDDLHTRGTIVETEEETATVVGDVGIDTQDDVTVISGSFEACLPRRGGGE